MEEDLGKVYFALVHMELNNIDQNNINGFILIMPNIYKSIPLKIY